MKSAAHSLSTRLTEENWVVFERARLARDIGAAETKVFQEVIGHCRQFAADVADPGPFLDEGDEGHVRNSVESVNPFAPAHRLTLK